MSSLKASETVVKLFLSAEKFGSETDCQQSSQRRYHNSCEFSLAGEWEEICGIKHLFFEQVMREWLSDQE